MGVQPEALALYGVEQVVGAVQADRHFHCLFLELRSAILSFAISAVPFQASSY
jgi:hypothetical protein